MTIDFFIIIVYNNTVIKRKKVLNMSKLIIHETDSHGCGMVYYNGQTDYYSYDDGDKGDLRLAIQYLINIGFIKAEDVLIFDDYNNIYKLVDSLQTFLDK